VLVGQGGVGRVSEVAALFVAEAIVLGVAGLLALLLHRVRLA
jgi:hypothetical protein